MQFRDGNGKGAAEFTVAFSSSTWLPRYVLETIAPRPGVSRTTFILVMPSFPIKANL